MIATDDRPLEGFEQRLLDELLDRAAALPPEPAPSPSRAGPRRRRRWQAVAVGGLATAAAFAVFALLPSAEQAARLTGGGDVPGLGAVAPELASAAEVRARAVAALASYDDAIVHAVQVTTTPNGTYRAEMWFDEAHPDRFRSLAHGDDGRPALDSSSRGGVGGRPSATRTIDHVARTWSETRTTGAATRSGVPVSLAAGVRGMLDAERLTLLERTQARGREALVLADDEPGMNRRLVIDAETYLPIRMTASWAPGDGYVIDYQWLVRTPETAALLWPDPPTGYERVTITPRSEQEAEAKAKAAGTGTAP